MRYCASLLFLLVGAAAASPEKVCSSLPLNPTNSLTTRSENGFDTSWGSQWHNDHSWCHALRFQVRQPAALGTSPAGHYLGHAVCPKASPDLCVQ